MYDSIGFSQLWKTISERVYGDVDILSDGNCVRIRVLHNGEFYVHAFTETEIYGISNLGLKAVADIFCKRYYDSLSARYGNEFDPSKYFKKCILGFDGNKNR